MGVGRSLDVSGGVTQAGVGPIEDDPKWPVITRSSSTLIPLERIFKESVLLSKSAARLVSNDYVGANDGSIRSPRAFGVAAGAEVLSDLHQTTVREWLSRTTGCNGLVATRCSYLYYDAGDYVGLHTDSDYCHYTVLLALQETDEPLFYFPQLSGLSKPELLAFAKGSAGHPQGGHSANLSPASFVAICGSAVPHHRPPVTRRIVLAALCYAAIGNPNTIAQRLRTLSYP